MKAAIYVRVSTEDQAERGHSLEAQKDMGMEFCQRQGWDYEIVEDAGISGESIIGRPGMVRLLERLQNREFDGVWVVDLDRLSRNAQDLLYITTTIRQNHIRLFTSGGEINLNDKTERFKVTVMAGVSELEKDTITERQMRGKKKAAQKGQWMGRYIPLGWDYDKETKQLLVNPKEAEVVRLIFRLCIEEGMNCEQIAVELPKRHIPTKLGGRWCRPTVYRYLTYTGYYGEAYFNQTYRVGSTKKDKPKGEWVKVEIPPIIERETFELAQEQLKRQKQFQQPRKPNYPFLLSGLLLCKECGRRLAGQCKNYHYRNGKRYTLKNPQPRYICNSWRMAHFDKSAKCGLPLFSATKVEKVIWDKMVELATNPGFVLSGVEDRQRELADEESRLHRRLKLTQEAIEDTEDQKARLLRAYREKVIDFSLLSVQMQEVEDEKKALREEEAYLIGKLQEKQETQELISSVEYWVGIAKENIESWGFEERRNFLRLLINRVWVDKGGNIEIEGSIPLREEDKSATILRPSHPFHGFRWETCTGGNS